MRARILVVDDEPVTRGVLRQVLTEEGHDVTEATGAEQALVEFRNKPFPLVITDIHMSGMSGLDLLKEIKALDSEAMVIVMTSNASLPTATAALRSGAYDYLTKPFDETEMISTVVKRAVDRSRLVTDNRALLTDLKTNAEELQRLNARLTDMVNRDGLTGLYNRRYFREAIEREVVRCRRHGRSFSLLFLDIDHFKHYNDTHGHLAGDELLRTLAALLKQRSRRSTVAARYGGEEFVLLVPETDRLGASRFAEAIRALVEQHPFPGRESQPTGKVTLSLGVATYPDDGRDATEVVDRADKALYQSKHRGRNVVSTSPDRVPA